MNCCNVCVCYCFVTCFTIIVKFNFFVNFAYLDTDMMACLFEFIACELDDGYV